jgi:hypothetical protein
MSLAALADKLQAARQGLCFGPGLSGEPLALQFIVLLDKPGAETCAGTRRRGRCRSTAPTALP